MNKGLRGINVSGDKNPGHPQMKDLPERNVPNQREASFSTAHGPSWARGAFWHTGVVFVVLVDKAGYSRVALILWRRRGGSS